MKVSRFTLLLTMVILMVIGAALLPLVDVADRPKPQQGKTLTVNFYWNRASAKVIEQNVTSRIEGLVSAVRGVESVESESRFGSGWVRVQLKEDVDVSSVKFEISSLLKQIHKRLPEGVSYPNLSGGEVVNEQQRKETTHLLLTYQVNSSMTGEQLKEYIQNQVETPLRRIEEVNRVEVTGTVDKYIEITYNPHLLAGYGVTAYDIETAIRNFMGRKEVVGEVHHIAGEKLQRMALYLTTDRFSSPLEEIPITIVGDKTIFLNDLASYEYKDREPSNYYRVNGLNTIYLNVFVDAQANKISLSRHIRHQIKKLSEQLRNGVYLTQTYDAAEEKESELHKLVWRTLMSLGILLVFVWLTKRSFTYLAVMVLTLAANILVAVIAYCLFDIRLHIYSLAGITVSLGLVIDASVVMVDHYGYYRNRGAFMAVLAALLTTIGSLVVVFWLPDFLKKDLYDFAWIIIINLSVALFVACLFAPALIDAFHYRGRQSGRVRRWRVSVWWSHVYTRYILFTQRHKWVYVLLIVMAFGIPFHALPAKWGNKNGYGWSPIAEREEVPWYEQLYNKTLGSDFFQTTCKEPLSNVFGGTMRLFAQSLSENTYSSERKREVKLLIRAQMPLGGSAAELNEKVLLLEHFLVQFDEIERFETRVESWGAQVVVNFKDEFKETSFPYILENKVIGKIISIGGADWSTSGVSERGFSNSLNLQYRSQHIQIVGYNYDRLYRIAEDMADVLRRNNRVMDLVIETPGHENQEDEFYMRYDKQQMALYNFDVSVAHRTLREMLMGRNIERYRDSHMSADMYLKSSQQDAFDLWHIQNAYLNLPNRDARLTDFMQIERRQAKNCIPKKNQEYVLNLAFNVLGSYTYTHNYLEKVIKESNARMPVGYRCENASFGWYKDDGTQYWLILLIVVIIFFICAILFESLRLPLAIIMLIPVSFIGTFLTYYFTGVEFGTGGFAALVLLSGLTVNAGIYIINEYQHQLRASRRTDAAQFVHAYVKAYNHKIVAVYLTILSTVLGLLPFFIDGKDEPFWFSFAVGTSGGLLFSIVALIFVMPILLRLSCRGNSLSLK